ncbi:MAG: epoxide hydrolase N-terminal domain-containing protein [Microthrixaceae bacterium]|nr:epoxide hydrolase N-terminal domain-containing protein [Microthrixaceae bacterium]
MSDEVLPFEIHHPDEQLDDLRSRLRNPRWPETRDRRRDLRNRGIREPRWASRRRR